MSTVAKLDPLVRINRTDRADTRRRIREAGPLPCHANERIERIVADPRFPGAWKQSQTDQLLHDLDEYTREQKRLAREEEKTRLAEAELARLEGVPAEPVGEGYDANGSPVE